ncbi:hypothetical protein TSAR_016273 [Trichomalopsis sarcophagae]|uniref:Uncharacterized protein n=1 Tax=Trichomalopsis sarcophagae TaxID=543379 RepID=A0A232F4R2_9HYME|nr:hypothetical protein TSAR_016273 [Trichomalopsis sarcophagae]
MIVSDLEHSDTILSDNDVSDRENGSPSMIVSDLEHSDTNDDSSKSRSSSPSTGGIINFKGERVNLVLSDNDVSDRENRSPSMIVSDLEHSDTNDDSSKSRSSSPSTGGIIINFKGERVNLDDDSSKSRSSSPSTGGIIINFKGERVNLDDRSVERTTSSPLLFEESSSEQEITMCMYNSDAESKDEHSNAPTLPLMFSDDDITIGNIYEISKMVIPKFRLEEKMIPKLLLKDKTIPKTQKEDDYQKQYNVVLLRDN